MAKLIPSISNHHRRMKAIVLIFVLLLSLLPWSDAVQARPGGGHSSSGHSSSHSSSRSSFSHSSSSSHSSFSSSRNYSGSGSGSSCFGKPYCTTADLVIILIIFIAIVILFIYLIKRNTVQSVASTPTANNRSVQQSKIQEQLALLKQIDPSFSVVLFLDFVHSLYTKFYSYATKPEFSYLTPFLSTELQQHFSQTTPWTINEIVINGMQWQDINSQGTETDTICLVIDANYTLHTQGKHSRYTVTERWLFYRTKGVLSPEPSKMQTLCCPQCGAPAQFTDVGLCEHCAHVIHKGERQWYLSKRVVLQTTALASSDLVTYAQEQGTQLSTIKQTDLAEQMQQFSQRHGYADWDSFWQPFSNDIVKGFFLAIYHHWSALDWQAVRHLLSDRLYEANTFWLNLYTEQYWHNRLDNLKIEGVVPAKIDTDKFYEAITVRIFASCYDYTEDANGKVIGGSKKKLRRYSEYWTFVRRIGVEQTHKPFSLTNCPQCGAPADNMGQTAQCGYCGSKISTGEFSWVLFLITQDEMYSG